MRTISWTWFWYMLIGFVLGGGAVYLWTVLKAKAVKLVWYEWVLLILTGITAVMLSNTFIASLQEGESQAALMSVVFLGLPIVIMLVVTLRSLLPRLSKA